MIKIQNKVKYLLIIIAFTFFSAIFFSKIDIVHANPILLDFKKGTTIADIKKRLSPSFQEITPKSIAVFFSAIKCSCK